VTAETGPANADVKQYASHSSFYMAMRLLPRQEREAMFAVYAFCRAVDDIADEGNLTRDERQAELNGWRADLQALYDGRVPARLAGLAGPARAFGLRKEDFLAAIDGVEMDVIADMCAPDLATLDLYCDRVASAIGRLSVRIFGMEDEPGRELAHHLGRALQLTNILRDLDEDAAIGRLYLPRELLDTAGVEVTKPAAVIAHARIDGACRALAQVAKRHYQQADIVMDGQPAGKLRSPKLMRAIYGAILEKMEAQGWSSPRERARIGRAQLFWIILRYGLVG
jgi:squalene synthase HpnD